MSHWEIWAAVIYVLIGMGCGLGANDGGDKFDFGLFMTGVILWPSSIGYALARLVDEDKK